MKTIEERAEKCAPDPFLAALERKAYIAGAKDQQYIDRLFMEQLIAKTFEYAKARYDLDYCGNVRDALNYLKSLVEE